MFRGGNKSALLSQRMITDAMLRLLADTPFSELTISALCKEAKVSRQTFYALFGTKEAVITHALSTDCCFLPVQQKGVCRSASFRAFCSGYSAYILRSRKILSLLVRNDMMHVLYDVQYRRLMDCESFMGSVTGEEWVYLIDFIVSGMTSIAKNDILTGCRADADYLEHLMHRLFGGMYFIGR